MDSTSGQSNPLPGREGSHLWGECCVLRLLQGRAVSGEVLPRTGSPGEETKGSWWWEGCSLQFKMVSYALGKAHMRSAPSLRGFLIDGGPLSSF